MVEVTFHVDEESSFERSDGGRDMTIEVDVENYFGWFQFEELRAMPVDTARRPMGATGVVGISQVDKEADEYEDFFENLEPEDFVEEEEQEEPEGGLNGFLGGLARRLRS